MNQSSNSFDLTRIIFNVLFISLMIIAGFWIVQPFILGAAWAGMIVIATWPLMKKVQNKLWHSRGLAVCCMILFLMLFFIIPIFVVSNSLIKLTPKISYWATSGNTQFTLPQLTWLEHTPFIGHYIANSWHNLSDANGQMLLAKIQPYAGKAATWGLNQAVHIGRFMIDCVLMLIFSALFYFKGEVIGEKMTCFALCLAPTKGNVVITLTEQSIRGVALGVVVTALIQSIIAGLGLYFTGIPYAALLTMIIFVLCVAQLGPLLVLLPAIIYLYWQDQTSAGTILLIITLVVSTIDSFIRPLLIRKGAGLPLLLILSGVIGGILSFGLIGLFIGPVVLAVGYRLVSVWMDENVKVIETQ